MAGVKDSIRYFGIAAVIFLFMFLSKIAELITDFWWFDTLGFSTIFIISLKMKIVLFLVSGLLFFLFAYGNMWLASHLNKGKQVIPSTFKMFMLTLLSVMVGAGTSAKWFTWLQYFNQTPFGLTDPIFAKDVAFYIFSLPFLLSVWGYLMTVIVLTTIVVTLEYLQSFIKSSIYKPKVQQVDPLSKVPHIPSSSLNLKAALAQIRKKAILHMTVLASAVFVLIAGKHYLTRYSIMYSEQGIVVGAGYTDVVVFLPIIKLLMVFAIVIVALFYLWLFYIRKEPKLKKKHIVATVLALYFAFTFFGPTLIPALVQSLKVSPNELNLEKPYIENNIEFTRIAYGLDSVEEKDFTAADVITASMLENASETIDNVRLLDWRPLTQTYKQTQEIRLYYDLSGIDIDRYAVDGKYTQVMIAPRELDQRQIAADAQTWVNLHLVYTHGFGAVVSPVNKVTEQGLPDYFVKDIPPNNLVGNSGLDITQPRIYYGEKDNQYVITNTRTEEFDYPQGSTNQYINYDGRGGVQLDSFFKKLMMAFRFKDIKIILTSDITTESRLMFHRAIQQRIRIITPFLELDDDPYLVIHDGGLYWIQDAYTVSGNFPYSQKIDRINYIRNSVKIVIDVYNGDVTYYTIGDEPLMQTYANIFPGQFQSIDAMPAGLRKQTRYPVDLFQVQSAIYSIYHMDDPTVFYNKEDAWQIPTEIYGTGQQVRVDPYYIIMKLPGEESEEFVLMTSFTPLGKDNMIGWMAARSDGVEYGNLLLYNFPKDKLVYGPLQIEAKFDQDSDISQQLTLWSQQGSSVTRGNLLVIPIEDSLLYIEPLYMQADKGKLPQLKRVLVSDGERVVMEETLGEALEALFGVVEIEEVEQEERPTLELSDDLAAQANQYYAEVLSAMEQGDWAGIGNSFDRLGTVLTELQQRDISSE